MTFCPCQTIPDLASSVLHLQKDEVPVAQAHQGVTPPEHECKSHLFTVPWHEGTNYSPVLLKFLHDFVRDNDKIVIETFYGGLDDKHPNVVTPVPRVLATESDSKSSQYHVSVSFYKVFQVSDRDDFRPDWPA